MRRRCENTPGGGKGWWVVLGGLLVGAVTIWVWQRRQSPGEEAWFPPAWIVSPDAMTTASQEERVDPRAQREPEDDLKVIEGIGPKVEAVLHAAGIRTYAHLATTPVEQLRAILREAGPAFRLADPSTWPEQARLAAQGAWDALREMQASLHRGRRATRGT